MVELKEENEILEEARRMFTALYSNGALARNEEEAKFLRAFRELDATNRIGIISRIEGMLEAQTYARMTEE